MQLYELFLLSNKIRKINIITKECTLRKKIYKYYAFIALFIIYIIYNI